jgi:hypothetical protein
MSKLKIKAKKPSSENLAFGIMTALLQNSGLTTPELVHAFAANISYLLANLPAADRSVFYIDLAGSIEHMIKEGLEEGAPVATVTRLGMQ